MKRILAFITACALGTTLFACGGTTANNNSEKMQESTNEKTVADSKDNKEVQPRYTIDFIAKATASEYWSYVVAGAAAYGIDHPDIKVDTKGATSETAYDEQQNMIETDLNSGAYDGYVISPLQADMVKNLISGVEKPIVAVDTKIEAPEIISFVGTDNVEAGRMGGKAAVEAAKKAGWDEVKAIAVAGVQGDGTCEARLEGYAKGVEEAGGDFLENEIQYSDTVADKAVNCAEAIMQTHPEGIAIILCINDDTAMATSRAISENDAYKNTVVLGFDATKPGCEAILRGEETMSVAQEAFQMGYKSVDAIVQALDGKEVEKYINSGCQVIDKSTAQQRLDDLNSYLK